MHKKCYTGFDKFKHTTQRLLDFYGFCTSVKCVKNFVVKEFDISCTDNNYRLANSDGVYKNCYKLPDFESYKVYIGISQFDYICVCFISSAESILVSTFL